MPRRRPDADRISIEIGKRLKAVRERLRLTPPELAEKADIFYTQYSRYEKGQDFMITNLYRIKQAIPNLNLNWLLTGEGKMFEEDVPVLPLSRDMLELEESGQRGEYVVIPFFREESVSAGGGAFSQDGHPQPLLLPKEYLRRYFGLTSYDGLTLIPVSGKSMEGSLPEESLALVKDWKREGLLLDGKVYVIRVDDLLYVKRVYFDKQKRKLYLKSDNPSVPEIVVDWDSSVEIIGRVVGCICFVSMK